MPFARAEAQPGPFPEILMTVNQHAVRQREAAIAASAAEGAAVRLLRERLTEAQLAQFDAGSAFIVMSADGRRSYEICWGISGNVRILTWAGRRAGALTRNKGFRAGSRICCHIRVSNVFSGVPVADHMLAQKLWLEADEKAFLALARPY